MWLSPPGKLQTALRYDIETSYQGIDVSRRVARLMRQTPRLVGAESKLLTSNANGV